jgi:hypothetical protein
MRKCGHILIGGYAGSDEVWQSISKQKGKDVAFGCGDSLGTTDSYGFIINRELGMFHLSWRVNGAALSMIGIFMKNTDNRSILCVDERGNSDDIETSEFMVIDTDDVDFSSSVVEDTHIGTC